MLTATQLREQVRDEAEREANVIIREAELRAEELMAQGRASIRELHSDVLSIKAQRRRATSELRATLESHLKLLKYYEDELESVEETVAQDLTERPFFDDDALQQAQELTLMLGEDLAPQSPKVDQWPRKEASKATVREPVKARLKPSSTERSTSSTKQSPRPARPTASSQGNSLHSSEMLQQVLSQIPQRVDPRELSLPPAAIKAEGDV
jgi:hypothetical protein